MRVTRVRETRAFLLEFDRTVGRRCFSIGPESARARSTLGDTREDSASTSARFGGRRARVGRSCSRVSRPGPSRVSTTARLSVRKRAIHVRNDVMMTRIDVFLESLDRHPVKKPEKIQWDETLRVKCIDSVREVPLRMLLLRRPGWGRVALGALARVLWFLFGVPCAWSLPRGAEREGASWGTAGDEDDARLHHDDCDASSPHVSRVDALRRAFALAGAADVPHVAGAFDEHLANVSRMLASWDLPEHVALAGYGHTLYGSELFPYAMGSFSVAARARARAAFGRDAEARCSCTARARRNGGTGACSMRGSTTTHHAIPSSS